MKRAVNFAVYFPFNFYAARTIKVIDEAGGLVTVIQNGSNRQISTFSKTLELSMWPYKQVIHLEQESSEVYVNVSLQGSSAASHLWTSLNFKTYLLLSKVSKKEFAQFEGSKPSGLVKTEKVSFVLYLLPVILIMYHAIINETNDYRNLAFLFATVTLSSLVPTLFRKKTGFNFLNRTLIGTLALSFVFIFLLKVEMIVAVGSLGLMLFTTLRMYLQGKLQLSNQNVGQLT